MRRLAAKRRLRAPSPAFVISLIALFVALCGTTYAAISLPTDSVGTKQLKKNAVTAPKIKDGAVTAAKINASGLTVPDAIHATSADSATSATTATNATTAANATHATNADSATHASTADNAGNATLFDGVSLPSLASAVQFNLTGTCSTGISAINHDGSVDCVRTAVVPIDVLLQHGTFSSQQVGDLELDYDCENGGFTDVFFVDNNVSQQATVNYFIWTAGAPTANGAVLPDDGNAQFHVTFNSGRLEGQFIFSIHGQEEITVNLHAIDNTVCEITGTAEYAPE